MAGSVLSIRVPYLRHDRDKKQCLYAPKDSLYFLPAALIIRAVASLCCASNYLNQKTMSEDVRKFPEFAA
jgi:hypothetical protein